MFVKSGYVTELSVSSLVTKVAPNSWGCDKYVSRKNCWSVMGNTPDRKQMVIDSIYHDGWTMFDVPVSELLDKYFACDATPIWRGHFLAIDITLKTKQGEIDYKVRNLNRLPHLQVAGGIDAAAVWIVDHDHLPTLEQVKSTFSQMTKQPSFTEVYYL